MWRHFVTVAVIAVSAVVGSQLQYYYRDVRAWYEAKYDPVIIQSQIEERIYNKEDNTLIVSGTFFKQRECYVEDLAASLVRQHSRDKPVPIRPVREAPSDRKYNYIPLGVQTWGPLKIYLDGIKDLNSARIALEVIYKCSNTSVGIRTHLARITKIPNNSPVQSD